MKKIAFVMNGSLPMPPVKGGAVETLVNTIVNDPSVQKKYQIDVFSASNSDNKKENNVNYYYINNDKYDKIKKCFRFLHNKFFHKYIGNLYISKLIKKYNKLFEQYDYVIIENRPEYGLVLRKYVKGKIMLHSHNEFIYRYKKRIKEISECYDKFIFVSDFMRNMAKPYIDNNKLVVLHNGVNISNFNINIDIQKKRKKYGLKKSDIVFLYTGRLSKEKGVLELIKAFNCLNNSNYKLIIAGGKNYSDNNENKYTKKLKIESNNNPNIIFTGFIPYNEMPEIYKIADYGVISSLWEEPFAMSGLEHLASGHPIVVTNSGGMPELVNDKCSVIVDKNDNIIDNLFEGINQISKMKNAKEECLKQINKFSREKFIINFLDILNK